MNDLFLWLEILYYISAPALLIVGIVWLKQLRLAKESMRLNAKRESMAMAVEQCSHYNHVVIPLINALDRAIAANDIKFFDMYDVKVDGRNVVAKSRVTRGELDKEVEKMKAIVSESCAALNAMNAFSCFFVSGVADEEVAFSSVGVTFCHTVMRFAPDILHAAQGGYYANVIELFVIWFARMERQRLVRKKLEIDSKLMNCSVDGVRPIGLE